MLSLNNSQFYYDPYPIGLASQVFPEDLYLSLVDSFPPRDLFVFKKHLGNKYSLSEVNNSEQYLAYIRRSKLWTDFHRWIKRESFVYSVVEMLAGKNVDMELPTRSPTLVERTLTLVANARALKISSRKIKLNARFEFSMLSSTGGCIKPHTDAPQKLITLVVSMTRPGEWNADFGGGTEVLRPKDITRNYNFANRYLEFDEVETIRTFPFNPNQCLIFVKTFNSLHAVRPMTGTDERVMRKTLTINIERLDR